MQVLHEAVENWRKSRDDGNNAWAEWCRIQAELAKKHGGCVKSKTGWYYFPDGHRQNATLGSKTPHPDGDECERLYESQATFSKQTHEARIAMQQAFISAFGEDTIRAVSL